MTQSLKAVLESLERALTPPTSYTNGKIAFYPNKDETGPAADLKRDTWEKCAAVLETGKAWLSQQQSPAGRHLSGTESDDIESVLAQDAEIHAFQEIVLFAQSAENLIHGEAA